MHRCPTQPHPVLPLPMPASHHQAATQCPGPHPAQQRHPGQEQRRPRHPVRPAPLQLLPRLPARRVPLLRLAQGCPLPRLPVLPLPQLRAQAEARHAVQVARWGRLGMASCPAHKAPTPPLGATASQHPCACGSSEEHSALWGVEGLQSTLWKAAGPQMLRMCIVFWRWSRGAPQEVSKVAVSISQASTTCKASTNIQHAAVKLAASSPAASPLLSAALLLRPKFPQLLGRLLELQHQLL